MCLALRIQTARALGSRPNKLANTKLWGEAILAKYGLLTGTAVVANKVDTVTLTTINTTTEIVSSAGNGLSVGLKGLGKLSLASTVASTTIDIAMHATCQAVADPDPIGR